jgi:hypothetical protein
MLVAYYFMWHTGYPAPEQCEGCTWVTCRSASYPIFILATSPTPRFAKAGTKRAPGTASLWAGRCLGTRPRTRSTPSWLDTEWARCTSFATWRQGSNVFETYWTTIRGVEAMDNNYRLLDLTVYGRQETWEDSPAAWPKGKIMDTLRTNGRPTSRNGFVETEQRS